MPDFDPAFLARIYDEPLKTSTASSLERNTNSSSSSSSKKVGPSKPDFTKPRTAWLFNGLQKGTQLRDIVADGDLARIDPAGGFSAAGFPPTFFLHGGADDWVPPRFSEQAHSQLKAAGVETHLVILPGLAHGFDTALGPADALNRHVEEAFAFLRSHV